MRDTRCVWSNPVRRALVQMVCGLARVQEHAQQCAAALHVCVYTTCATL